MRVPRRWVVGVSNYLLLLLSPDHQVLAVERAVPPEILKSKVRQKWLEIDLTGELREEGSRVARVRKSPQVNWE